MDNLDNTKSSKKYRCEKCDYTTSKYSQYTRHLETIKHNRIIMDNKKIQKSSKPLKMSNFSCLCGKTYLFMSGLCKHKNKCSEVTKFTDMIMTTSNNDNIIELLKQNEDFKALLIEQNKQIIEQNKQIIELSKNASINNITQYNTTNSNKFNLNFFLNEQCKDALNIKDFINSIELKIKDLEIVGKLGYAEGISQIIVNGLKKLDVYKRPMHCSDIKREVLYVKDENKWEKENEDKNKFRSVIKEIANKNIKQIPEWIKMHPDYKEYSSKTNDEYIKILTNSMTGDIEEQNKNINQIVKNISKEIVIEK